MSASTSYHPPPPPHHHQQSTTAADAEFLSELSTTTTAAVGDLHKTNVLRLEVDELLQASTVDYMHVKWHGSAQDYIAAVTQVIETMSLSNLIANTNTDSSTASCPFRTVTNKPIKWPAINNNNNNSKLRLQVKPTGCYQAEGLGMLTTAANAKMVPTLDLNVVLPADLLDTKDYLQHKGYFAVRNKHGVELQPMNGWMDEYIKHCICTSEPPYVIISPIGHASHHHQKRNAIVWHTAQHLASKQYMGTIGQVSWYYDHDDQRKPILMLQPPVQSARQQSKKKKKKPKTTTTTKHSKPLKLRVLLHFGVEDWKVPPLRLVPNRCNLGGSHTHSQLYNHALLEDLFEQSNGETLHSVLQQDLYVHWEEAIRLAQIWCLQRGLLRRHDGLTTEMIAWTLVYVYRSRAAGPRLSALQVVQAWWKMWMDTNWLGDTTTSTTTVALSNNNTIRKAPSEAYVDIRDGPRKRTALVMPCRDGASQTETMAQSDLAQLYARQTKESPLTPNDPPTLLALYEREYTLGPVLLDASMRFNILGRVSPAVVRQLQHDAHLSLERLHQSHRPFGALFMKEARFWKRYDAYLRIPYRAFDFNKASQLWGQDRTDLGDAESIRRGLVSVLSKALGDRVREIQILSTGNGPVNGVSSGNSDEIPALVVGKNTATKKSLSSPTGDDGIVLGLTLDPDVCFRIVDRGPPADDAASTEAFTELWGSKAELRRFKDGAILHATVWNDNFVAQDDYYHYLNDDKIQGGIVERIIRYILGLHFVSEKVASQMQFSLRDMLSCVDGVQPGSESEVSFNPLVAHRLAMKAFESLSDFLRESSRPSIPIPGTNSLKSRLGIPLAIDAVEPLAPCLRYTELFPPVPHPLIGGGHLPGMHRASQAVHSSPISVQIRFGSSSKWPNDLKAIKAAKTAMLIQMLDGIETLKNSNDQIASKFGDHSVLCADSVDVTFQGYVFRITVRADPEIRLLQGLMNPTEEAVSLLRSLTRQHLIAAKHHSIVHAVYTRYASASTVVRMAQRWVASHLLSNHFSFETIELLVAYLYSSPSNPTEAPGSATAGFLRFLELLASHDWKREPLIVDPQNSFSMEVHSAINKDFETIRGPDGDQGPPLFVISPSDRSDWDEEQNEGDKAAGRAPRPNKKNASSLSMPSFSTARPEWVVLNRAVALAARSHQILQQQLQQFENTPAWSSVFAEPATSFGKYSVLMRVDPDFVLDTEASSSGGKTLAVVQNKTGLVQSSYTRSMIERYKGPKLMQRKLFKNLVNHEDILFEWQPVNAMLAGLERELGHLGLFFYNHLCPEVVGVLWRPGIFEPKPFSAIQSEWARPVVDTEWKSDTLVTKNVSDILIQASKYTSDIVTDLKVLDQGMKIKSSVKKRPLKEASSESESEDEEIAEKNDSDDSESEDDEPAAEKVTNEPLSESGRSEDDGESESE
eukprot:scaffold23639_cov191-Amphora_coffeaeformis.AAC.1